MPARRSVARFALHFALVFPVCVWLYLELRLPYQELAVALANPLLGVLEPGFEVRLDATGGWQVFRATPGGEPTFYYGLRPGALDLLYVNLALLPALVLATPVRLPERLRLLAWGLALVLACHALTVLGLVRTYHCLRVDPESFFCGWLRNSLKVSGQLAAMLQWGLVTWRHWLPAPRR